jgi:hypothetical protein
MCSPAVCPHLLLLLEDRLGCVSPVTMISMTGQRSLAKEQTLRRVEFL